MDQSIPNRAATFLQNHNKLRKILYYIIFCRLACLLACFTPWLTHSITSTYPIYLFVVLAFYLLFVILYSSSFATLGPLEMGVAKNNLASSIDKERVYMGGRYFLGLGKEFVTYPSEAVLMEISEILASTQDKQNVKVDISLQYHLRPEKLIALYNERQQSYDSFYRREITAMVKEECVLWETIPDFYESRDLIAAQIEIRITSLFENNHARLAEFQLLGIRLQPATEQKIIETLVAEQGEITESIFQQSSVVRSEKAQFTIAADGQVRIINSNANAIGIDTVAKATAEAFGKVTTALSNRLSSLEDGLGLGSASKVMLYSFYNAFTNIAGKTDVTIGAEINLAKL